MNKMLEELAEVVRLDRRERDHAAGYGFYLEPDAPYAALTFLQTHHATITDMAKRLEAAERDAARLDWLHYVSKTSTVHMNGQHPWNMTGNFKLRDLKGPTLRAAIDAAMRYRDEQEKQA